MEMSQILCGESVAIAMVEFVIIVQVRDRDQPLIILYSVRTLRIAHFELGVTVGGILEVPVNNLQCGPPRV